MYSKRKELSSSLHPTRSNRCGSFLFGFRKQVVDVNDNLEYNCMAVGIKLATTYQKSCQT